MGDSLRLAGTNVDAAATAELDPAIAFELAISGADRVGVEMKAPCQIASAGQSLARLEIVAQDAEDDLRDQLFADGDFAAAGKPELHGGNIISCRLPGEKVVKAKSRNHCRFSGSGSMMKRMNLSETIFLFFLALIIFGPKKLPEIARQIGKYMNEFRRASNEFKAQIEQEIAHLEVEKPSDSSAEPGAGGHCQPYVELCAERSRAQPESDSADVPATLAASEEDEPLFASKNGSGATDRFRRPRQLPILKT